jgi:hypothetical protein
MWGLQDVFAPVISQTGTQEGNRRSRRYPGAWAECLIDFCALSYCTAKITDSTAKTVFEQEEFLTSPFFFLW